LSFTDTDHLTEYNRGYNHKGIYVSVPVRMLQDRDSRGRYHYSLSPWSRDVAASVYHGQDLFRMGQDLMPADFSAGLNEIKE